MKEIVCPNCGTTFTVDESMYAAIVEQVRNQSLTEEVERRMADMEEKYQAKNKADSLEVEKKVKVQLDKKDAAISQLNAVISELRAKIEGFEDRKNAELAVLKADNMKETAELSAKKDKQILELNSLIKEKEAAFQLALEKEKSSVKDSFTLKEQEIFKLKSELETQKTNAEKHELELKEQHGILLQAKEDEIERLRNFKSRLSTKMIGEDLEQHCANEFERAQAMGMFPGAEFGKDNDSSQGSKGDFIFRDFADGEEYVSVMFEMKNEVDTTATKHKNTDFLDKLHKDRCTKNCEYAVLVSMLEQDNDLYNTGIVDFSHKHPKMLCIRPQFFLPLLRVLTQASKKNVDKIRELNAELTVARAQSLDISKFETKLEKFRNNFDGKIAKAHKKYQDAIGGIDKIIEGLEKQIKDLRNVKANFEDSERNLLKANEIVNEDFTIKKLTHGNPGMRARFEEARKPLLEK